ncbi:hypothetical protein NXY56_006454 [Leishmania guyanensis]
MEVLPGALSTAGTGLPRLGLCVVPALCCVEAVQGTGWGATVRRSPALEDNVLCNPVADAWMFPSKLFHSASRRC